MSNKPSVTLRDEVWMVENTGSKAPKSTLHGSKRPVRKIAFRVDAGVTTGNRPGTFHGATNLRGTFRP